MEDGQAAAFTSTVPSWSGGSGWTCRCTVQYGRWIGGILLRGDLGKPLLNPEPVGQLIAGRLLTTAELGLVALIVGVLIGVPTFIYSAVRHDTVGDYVGRSCCQDAESATPNGWLATMASSSFRRSGGAGRRRCDWCA